MSHNLTEANEFSTPITVPDNGDAAEANSPLVELALQKLTNRTRYLNQLHNELANLVFNVTPAGLLLGGSRISCADGATLKISRIATVYLNNYAYATGGNISSPGGATTFTPAGLVANTWHYLYAYIDTGLNAVAYEVRTTPPEDTLVFCYNDHTRRYLGCFVTNAVGGILPFTKTGGRYLYRRSALPAYTGTILLNGEVPSAPTALPLVGGSSTARLLPPHARVIELFAQLHCQEGQVDARLQFGTETDSTWVDAVWASPGLAVDQATIRLDLGDTQAARYNGNGRGPAYVWALGFEEGF